MSNKILLCVADQIFRESERDILWEMSNGIDRLEELLPYSFWLSRMCVRYPISSTGIHINSIEFDRALESLPGAIIQISFQESKEEEEAKKK